MFGKSNNWRYFNHFEGNPIRLEAMRGESVSGVFYFLDPMFTSTPFFFCFFFAKNVLETLCWMIEHETFDEVFGLEFAVRKVLLGMCFPSDISRFSKSLEMFVSVLKSCLDHKLGFVFFKNPKDTLYLVKDHLLSNKEAVKNVVSWLYRDVSGEVLKTLRELEIPFPKLTSMDVPYFVRTEVSNMLQVKFFC